MQWKASQPNFREVGGNEMAKKKAMSHMVAEKALVCLSEGDCCPRIERLLLAINGRRPKGRLYRFFSRVRRRLEEVHGLHVCTVCFDFYNPLAGPDGREIRASFDERPPESREEARMCLAGGRGKKIGGLYFPQASKTGDLIYEEWTVRRLAEEMKPARRILDRAGDAMENRILSRRRLPNRIGGVWEKYLGEPCSDMIERACERAMAKVRLEISREES